MPKKSLKRYRENQFICISVNSSTNSVTKKRAGRFISTGSFGEENFVYFFFLRIKKKAAPPTTTTPPIMA